jgi:integrase
VKRIFEASPVTGYQIFRYEGARADGSAVLYPNYYIRHGGKETNTKTGRLPDVKAKVKKMAGADFQEQRRLSAPVQEVRVGALLDLVIEDYVKSGQKTIADVRGKIEHGLRPYFGDLLAEKVDSDEIDQWMRWRLMRRLRKSPGQNLLQPASVNRELSILRRAYQLGYARKPQLVTRIPPMKKLGENNVRKGFISPEQYRALMAELPEHLRGITCVAYHVANRKGELFHLEWSDVELDGNPPVFTLWPGETKNKDGRTLPILPGEMLDTLRGLKACSRPGETHVFLNAEGRPLAAHMMRRAWSAACTRAGLPGLLFHDLRRSAVRNLRRAGVTETVARQFSGHKTAAVFSRYNITDFNDLKDAAARLGEYLGEG